MGNPSWREIKKVSVPDPAGSIWTPALDYVTPNKLYRLAVEPVPDSTSNTTPPPMQQQMWTPESGSPCTADGDQALSRTPGLDTCAVGALIGKVGGSSSDIKIDAAKLILFSVGRHCVFSVTDPLKTGSLYLGINDTKDSVAKVTGQLTVTIYEAL